MPEGIDARLEALARRRTRLVAALPSTGYAVQALRHIVDYGLPGYSEPGDDPLAIPDTLPADLRDELIAWEERQTERAQLWAEDRFKLGFALGAGLSTELLLDLPGGARPILGARSITPTSRATS